jgi:hypothetical protein
MKIKRMRELLACSNDDARLNNKNSPIALIKSQAKQPAYKPKHLDNLYPHFYLE